MDIFELPKNDHSYYKQLLEMLIQNTYSESEIKAIIKKLKTDLVAHRMAEEETFFEPILKLDSSLKEEINLTKKKHLSIEELIEKIQDDDVNNDSFHSNLINLKELVYSDIHKEEDKMLRSAEKFLSKEDALKMAQDMIVKKSRFEENIFSRFGHRVKEFVGI